MTNKTPTLPVFDAPADGRLTAPMRSAYAAAGVVILRNFVSPESCAALRQRAAALVDGYDPAATGSRFSTTQQMQLDDDYFIDSGDKIRFFLEAEAFDAAGKLHQDKHDSLNKIGHALHDLDPVFDAFSRTPQLAALVASIGVGDPVIIQSMYIFKPPHIGGEVVCHQDSTFIHTEPESCIGLWFALQDATLDNGCMQFIPGVHRKPLKRRNYRRQDGKLVTETLDPTPWSSQRTLPAEATAGSLVIFDGRTPHLSGANRSARSRHAYTLHVIDRNCHYPASNWLQRGSHLPLRGFA